VLLVSGVSEVGLDCGEKVRLKKFQAVITEYCREGWGGGGEVVDGTVVTVGGAGIEAVDG
jgi:hypothetical protein